MIDEDIERLAWQQIDGVISPEDLQRLEEFLEKHPDTRADLDELTSLSNLLDRVEEEPVPAHLRPRIDSALAAASPGWHRPAPVVNIWRPRLAFVAAGFVAGAVVAGLLLPVSRRAVEPDRTSGAMHTFTATAGAEFDLGEGIGTLSLRRQGSLLEADLGLALEGDVALVLEAEGGELRVRGASHGVGATSVFVDGGRVEMRVSGGGRHLLSVERESDVTAVRVRVESGGRVLVEHRLEPAETGG